jgi:hypothetical protein
MRGNPCEPPRWAQWLNPGLPSLFPRDLKISSVRAKRL